MKTWQFRLKPAAAVNVALLGLALQFGIPGTEARELYRYRNIEGNVVVDYQVPVEYAGAGYEILNDDGMVKKVVPRELTPQERIEKDAEEKQIAAAEAEQERLREWDESLLLRYSTIADIEAARDRALGDLKIRLSILRSNRRSLKQTVENYQAEAADMERRGLEIDVSRLRAIEDLQGEIATTERAIADREVEIEEIKGVFTLDIERFEMLQEVVALRQTLRLERAKREQKSGK